MLNAFSYATVYLGTSVPTCRFYYSNGCQRELTCTKYNNTIAYYDYSQKSLRIL